MYLIRQDSKAICIAACIAFCPFLVTKASATERVPFVGCAGDGQVGPVAAPKGAPKLVDIDPAAARELAFYQARDSFGVLAPRGWKCFYVYGSSGASLMIAPSGNLKSMDTSLSGAAVVASFYNGDTSGRFEVAKYAARLFPKEAQAFIASVIAEGIEPKKDFPSGRYPADKVTYKNPRLVEFETPANSDGLGTSDRLQKNNQPIDGMAALKGSSSTPNFFLLAVRLPPKQVDLGPAIIAEAE